MKGSLLGSTWVTRRSHNLQTSHLSGKRIVEVGGRHHEQVVSLDGLNRTCDRRFLLKTITYYDKLVEMLGVFFQFHFYLFARLSAYLLGLVAKERNDQLTLMGRDGEVAIHIGAGTYLGVFPPYIGTSDRLTSLVDHLTLDEVLGVCKLTYPHESKHECPLHVVVQCFVLSHKNIYFQIYNLFWGEFGENSF